MNPNTPDVQQDEWNESQREEKQMDAEQEYENIKRDGANEVEQERNIDHQQSQEI